MRITAPGKIDQISLFFNVDHVLFSIKVFFIYLFLYIVFYLLYNYFKNSSN